MVTFSVAARTRLHRAVQYTLRRLIEQAGGYADVERHVPELHDGVSNDNDAAPNLRCAILDVSPGSRASCNSPG